jgi:hypothetical protein
LTCLTAVIYGWEFLGSGNVLELTYYFSYFAIPIALTMASVTALVVSLDRSRWSLNAGVVIAAALGAIVPLALIYRDERVAWTGRTGMRISIAVMAVAVLVVLGFAVTRRTRVGTVAAIVAAGAIAGSCHFAINSSTGTFVSNFTAPNNRSLYHAALDLVAFANRSTKRHDPVPAFWYRAAKHPDLSSIQSMYYWGYTAIAFELPSVSKAMRDRLDLWKPQTIVMLCKTRGCGGGAEALRRAGYRYTADSASPISEGQERLWAVLLRRSSQ